MRKLILSISIFLITATGLSSQELLSLDEAISIGIQNNFNIQIRNNQQRIAERNNSLGLAGFLPQVDLTGSASAVNNETETNLPPIDSQTDIENVRAELSMNWTLFDGFRMFANKTMFNELAEMSSYQARDNIEQTIVAISQSYLNIIQQKQILEASIESREISALRLRREKSRNSIGGASSTDFYKAQVAFNVDESNLLRQKTNAQLAYEQLNVLMGREPLMKFQVADEIHIPELSRTYDEIVEQSLHANSGLKVAELQQSVAKRKVQLARAIFYPRVKLFAGFEVNDLTRNSNFGDFPLTDIQTETSDATVGLVVSLNLFNGQRDKVELDNARIERINQELAYRDAQNRLKAYISEVHNKFKQQEAIVALERHNIESAEQNLILQQERNKLGVANSLDFRDAQLSLFRAQTSLISAQFQAAVFRLEIDRLSGRTNLR